MPNCLYPDAAVEGIGWLWLQAEVPKCAGLRPVLALKPTSAPRPATRPAYGEAGGDLDMRMRERENLKSEI